ncbi:MAG: zf-TFIIB domain-containing protein [Armatimonadetes bacterium]|nr:zf-TFIIB domain-containing protein [Armatimonadota bacterium]
MLCPKCHDQIMVIVERSGVEIEYCPGCRGVFLDRGELEKLIVQADPHIGAPAGFRPVSEQTVVRDSDRHERSGGYRDDGRREGQRRREDDDDDDYRDRKKRRGGFLSEIFDFD